jgi:hypothetical protein
MNHGEEHDLLHAFGSTNNALLDTAPNAFIHDIMSWVPGRSPGKTQASITLLRSVSQATTNVAM